MLLRHAKSDWSSPGAHDFSRPLNARGNAAARLMGGYIVHHRLVPDRILCSPSTRTRETLDAMALPDVDDIVFDNRLEAAAAETILSVIADKGGSAKKLMVIGHNPG